MESYKKPPTKEQAMNNYMVQIWDIKKQTYEKPVGFHSKNKAFKYAEEIRNTGDGYEYSAQVYEWLPTS